MINIDKNILDFIENQRVIIESFTNFDELDIREHLLKTKDVLSDINIGILAIRSNCFESEIIEINKKTIFIYDVSFDDLITNIINLTLAPISIDLKREVYMAQMKWAILLRSLNYTNINFTCGLFRNILSDKTSEFFSNFSYLQTSESELQTNLYLRMFFKRFLFFH